MSLGTNLDMTSLTSYYQRMGKVYSTYEAKARFSELLRQVREGKTVTISYRGEPVAELRPIGPRKTTIEARLDALERRGVLVRQPGERKLMKGGHHVPGALERFLADRD